MAEQIHASSITYLHLFYIKNKYFCIHRDLNPTLLLQKREGLVTGKTIIVVLSLQDIFKKLQNCY
jgi:hypothetical protein